MSDFYYYNMFQINSLNNQTLCVCVRQRQARWTRVWWSGTRSLVRGRTGLLDIKTVWCVCTSLHQDSSSLRHPGTGLYASGCPLCECVCVNITQIICSSLSPHTPGNRTMEYVVRIRADPRLQWRRPARTRLFTPESEVH